MIGEMFIKGIIIGLSIAAPVGPIGILSVHRTLKHGRFIGFVSGLGAATADGVYALIACLGLTFITNFLVSQQFWLHLLGGMFICYLGIKFYFSIPSNTSAKAKGSTPLTAYISTFLLTITNPVTILLFMALFSGLQMTNNDTIIYRLFLVLGVFIGSTLWWIIISNVAGIIGSQMQSIPLGYINQISGVILFCFGIYNLFQLGIK